MKIDSLFVNIFLLKSVSYWHASICLRRIATLIFWPQYLKLRKYLGLKLYFKYLKFYWHAVLMICWCTQCVHPNTILKFLIGYQNYFKSYSSLKFWHNLLYWGQIFEQLCFKGLVQKTSFSMFHALEEGTCTILFIYWMGPNLSDIFIVQS